MRQDPPVTLFCRDWTAPKDGNSPDQNEDACLVRWLPGDGGSDTLLIAVADGATESVYSGRWARALVAAAEPDWPTLSDDELTARLEEVRRAFSPIGLADQTPWYVRNKYLMQGSQATLMVLTLAPAAEADRVTARAVSVGDCCLLLFRASGEIGSFPMQTAADFGVTPELVRNRPQPGLSYSRAETWVQPGDVLLVCTDAVGKWALQCLEMSQAGDLFDALLGLLTPARTEPAPTPPPAEAEPASPPSEVLSSSLPAAAADGGSAPTEDHLGPKMPPPEKQLGEGESVAKRLQRFLRRLRLVRSPEDQPAKETAKTLPPVAPENQQPIPPESHTPEVPAAVPSQSLEFEEFLERQRALDSRPRMRNDDATLVVCLHVRTGGGDQSLEALEVIRRHKAAAGQQRTTIEPVATPLGVRDDPGEGVASDSGRSEDRAC